MEKIQFSFTSSILLRGPESFRWISNSICKDGVDSAIALPLNNQTLFFFLVNSEYCHEDKLTFEVASKALHLSEETTEAVTPSSSNGNLKDRATTSAKGTSRLLTSTKKFLGAFNKHRSNGSLSNFESASSLCELASDSSSYDLDHLSVSSPSNNNNASSSSSSIATAGSSSSITAQKRKYFSLGGLELKSDIITSNFTYKIGTLACELISILPRSESGIDVSEFDQQGIFGSIDIRACFIPYSSRIEV